MKALLPLTLVISLAACSRGGESKSAAEAPDAQPKVRVVAEPPACPFATFDAFLERFMDDETTQHAFVRTPLRQTRLDASAQPEPKPVTAETPADSLSFPLMPTRAAIAASGLTLQVEQSPAGPRVKIEKPDTDRLAYYQFERTDCWRLVAIDDRSL